MARRRMIDPNFWQSEDVSKLTIRQRLLLIGLFSNADDEGKLRGNPAYVRSAVFPYEDFTLSEIEDDLNKIQSIGSIIQYVVEESKYIKLINWFKFQRVDKPQRSVIPNHDIDVNNHSENDSKNDSSLKEVKEKEKEYKQPDSQKIVDYCNKLKIQLKGIYDSDRITSFVGCVDTELILEAIKRSEGKNGSYVVKILEDWSSKKFNSIEDTKPKDKHTNKVDPQILARHREIAFNRFIDKGGNPNEFIYNAPTGT